MVDRPAIEACILLGIEETISAYILALPATSLGCIGSILDNVRMSDMVDILRDPESTEPNDQRMVRGNYGT